MNSSVLVKSGGFVLQRLRKLRGNRPGVVAALFTVLLFIAGCGGSSKTATPTPTFTPPAGSYSATQNVTVSDTNQNAVLYCTNDGSKPTTSSPQCANPIKVSQSQTLNAIAVAPGMDASTAATASYTIVASAAAPTVTGIGPATGPAAGGTSVTVIGTNFTGVTSVNFGTIPATSFTLNSATSITAVSPAGAGTVHVTVVTTSGTSATNNSDQFTYSVAPTPTIANLTPNSGLVGTSVAIIGTNFGSAQGTSTVTFNGTLATSITLWSSTSIVATVPAGATTGNVVVTVGGVASAGAPFTVTLPVPAIAQLTPGSGVVGSSVAIIGTNFGTAQSASTVTFNGTPAASITSWSPTAIVAAVPTGATTGNVVVTVSGVASAGVLFTVTVPPPSITSLNTSSGKVGDSVTITGANFGSTSGTSTVTFNGTAATTITNWSATSITAQVPTGATTGNVAVTVNGTVSNGVSFTVNSSAPTISSLNPASGAVGSPVTITGTNFGSSQGTSTVTFGGMSATSITSWSPTSITAVIPSGATTGNVVVTVNGTASNGISFTVLPTPSISQLQPASGTVGSSITITGTNFGSTQGTSTVTFPGTTIAASITNWSNTQIVATIPSNATGTGNVVVTVNGIASAGSPFTVLLTPTISGLSTNTGAVGASVTITGTNFGSTQGTSTVTFNGIPATSITNWSNTSIVVTVPTGATTGNVVVTVSGVASAGMAFTVPGSPTISQLTPAYGLPGSPVTITGQNFGTMQGTVSFNGTASTVTSWSATSIVVTVPAGATTGNVAITAVGVTTNGLLFTITPTISKLSPATAAVSASVTITGTNFGSSQGTSAVSFPGTMTPASITSWSDTSIVAKVPSDASGAGVVVVTVNGAPSAGSAFTVLPPPAISRLSPSMAVPGGADFTLTITGTNFDSTAVVNWGSTTLTPTNITSTQITVTVPAAQIAKAGTADVTVTEDDGTSNSETFTIATFIGGKVLSGPSSNGTAISASVQLYAAGTSGYGTGPQKVGSEVQSDSKTGAFAVTYDCSALTTPGGDQLYLVAQGSTSGTVLMTALGSCNSISSSFPSGVTINEATTIASAYALSAFASIDSNGGIDIGAPANTTTGTQCDPTDNWKSTGPSTCNYIGLKNAFATVQNLVDVASGAACVITPAYSSSHSCLSTSGSTPKYNISYVPQQRVNSLANVLAACANPSAGGAACDSLFTGATATGSNQPKDTLQAALSIALHPGNNANQIAGLVPSTPFTPTISSSDAGLLTDWALAVVYEGAGIGRDALSGMAIDAAGNVWLTAYNGYAVSYGGANITPNTIGYVAVFNNQGGPLSPAATSSTLGGYNGNGIYNPQAIAIDQNGYAWIGNYPTATTIAAGNPGSVSVLDVHGSPQYGTGTTPFTNQVLLNPNGFGIAVDAGNTVWVSSNASTANHINCSSGTYGGSILPLTGSASGGVTVAGNAVDTYSDSSSCPSHLAIDLNNNLWTYDHSQSGGKDPHSGLKLFGPDGSSVAGPYYYDNQIQNSNIAIDSNGNGWLFDANYNTSNGTVDVISPAEIGSNNAEPGKQLYVVDYWGSMYWSEGSSPVVLDGASQAWTANNNEEGGNQGYLFETNSSDTALLSPMASDGTPWGFVGWDASSGTPNPLDTAARSPLEVDGSGNLWLANGSQLSEFIGIAVPTRTPLGSALVGSNTPGTRP